jgi:glycosyltransferase involved in cell wall biosynthesis
MIKNSILLCTFNEAKYIEDTILHLEKSIPHLEIIIVDDASTDNTLNIIKNLKTSCNLKVINRNKIQGLGSAFQRALIESQGENIGWIDTNMGELANKFPLMIEELKSNDLILLSRYVEGGSDERIFIRVFCSKLINFFCRLILSNKIRDYTSSIFIMKRNVLNETTLLGYGHGDFFIEFLYSVLKKNFQIKEIPYKQKADEDDGGTKTSPNLLKFFILGFFYFLRVLLTRFRRD